MLAKTISAHIFFTRSTQIRDNEDCTAPHYVAIRHPYVAPTTRVPGKKKHNCDISDGSEGCFIPRSMFHNHSYTLGFIQRNRAFVLQHGGLHISTREAVPPRASHGQGSFGHISHVCFLS